MRRIILTLGAIAVICAALTVGIVFLAIWTTDNKDEWTATGFVTGCLAVGFAFAASLAAIDDPTWRNRPDRDGPS